MFFSNYHTYPILGSNAIALGESRSFDIIIDLKTPSAVAASIVSSLISVQ